MIRKSIKKIIDTCIYCESFFVRQDIHVKRRVLILRKDTLGDYILFYPSLQAYRKAYSDSDITLVLSSLFKGFSPLLNDFERIVWFDAKQFSFNIFYRRRFLLDLKRKGYDIAIQPTFSREPSGDFMIKMTGASVTIGVDGDCTASTPEEKKRNNILYTNLVSVPDTILTEMDKNKYIAEQITGQKISITFPTVDISIFSDISAEKIIKESFLEKNKYVIFFPGSGTRFKVWPTEKFAEIADYLIEKGLTPVMCGSKGEKGLVLDIILFMKNKNKVIDISGKIDLPTMFYLLQHSRFYFGSDTGITHMAAAICVPTVCILGGGHFRRFFPYGNLVRNRIVFDKTMKCENDNWVCSRGLKDGESSPCIKNITVEDTKKEIDILLQTL